MTTLDALARAPLFEGMGQTGLRIFAGISSERTLATGERLFAQGDAADALYVVKSGGLRLLARGASGEREVATLGPGDHVGELALLAPGERLVSAAATGPTELVALERREFFRMAQRKPQACLKLSLLVAAVLARRVGDAREALQGALVRAVERDG